MLLLLLLLPKLLQSIELTSGTESPQYPTITSNEPPGRWLFFRALNEPETPEPPRTLQKQIEECPNVGYFFERQELPGHPGTCYLCYCKNDGLAVCTLRESQRCEGDDGSYQKDVAAVQHSEFRRRVRRNPGLMELFFNDAKKDLMMKSMVQANEEDCKPKASKSIGCPPKDWCKGCLVCDCDDNGEWQCHVMSFCEDKTPRPRANNIKKTVIKGTETLKSRKNETTSNAAPRRKKKTDKRSVKSNKKKNLKKVSTTTTTTTKKPAAPPISVKTLKKFIRKDQMNGTKNVLVIKKYISTMAPIDSPELLKYMNDSRKLAQILYQQYEASTKQSKTAKREIKIEKLLNTKQKRNYELKYNARGRKPMNVKEHYVWNEKTKAKKAVGENKNLTNFYSIQNALMTPDEKNKDLLDFILKKRDKKKKENVIYYPRKRRYKRDVLPITEASRLDSTTMENEIVNNSSVDSDQVSEKPGKVLRNEDETALSPENYKYTVDTTGTHSYDKEGIHNDTIYETTFKNVDVVYTDNLYFENENSTTTNTLNYTYIEDESTTKQVIDESQTLGSTDYTISELISPDYQLKSKTNDNLVTTTSIDFIFDGISTSDKQVTANDQFNLVTTTLTPVDNSTLESRMNENMEMNKTDNKINNNPNEAENIIKKVYLKDIDMIITDLNKYKVEKWMRNNKTYEVMVNNFTSSPNHSSVNRTLTYFKTDFDKMLQSFNNNNTKNTLKQSRMVGIKYLKKLYGQLLSSKNNKSRLNNVSVMESICDSFGPCKIGANKVGIINSKITDLIAETKKALDIIKRIKEHLQLVDGDKNTKSNITEDVEFKRYVKKLNAIITDSYETPLTAAEMARMNHIKNNTKIFINSIGNFANILNDILKIIRSERTKFDNLRKRKIIINRVTRHKVDNRPLNKIKNLFLRFNLLQNTFMHNMYKAISELEKQNGETQVEFEKSKNDQKNNRYKTSVNKYMNKINYNLEKLKELALKMGAKGRRKRAAMKNDDAVEYLLTLMEYLLKRNNPVDAPAVADGIDLLIDAIRRAPDIRPIRKKALKQMSSVPPFPYFKASKSSSESEDDNVKKQKGNINENLSFEKQYSNDTLVFTSKNNKKFNRFETYSRPTSVAPVKPVTTTAKYVDVEDLVFNGDVVQKVYIATVPAYENTDEPERQELKPLKPNKPKAKINESSSSEDDAVAFTKVTDSDADAKNETNNNGKEENNVPPVTESTVKTQFDRLNEEYEKQLKGKAPVMKNQIKRRKSKRLRKKQKDAKSDVSTITKEVDEEKTRKKAIAEEAILRKHVIASNEDDPFQSMDDESTSRDISPLDGINNEVFPNYFSK